MIEFKDVAFQYEQGSSKGKIENINLTIHDGEVVLICGESGCGKTTLTRLINGLIPHYYEGTLTGQTIVEGIYVKNVSLYALSGVCAVSYTHLDVYKRQIISSARRKEAEPIICLCKSHDRLSAYSFE